MRLIAAALETLTAAANAAVTSQNPLTGLD